MLTIGFFWVNLSTGILLTKNRVLLRWLYETNKFKDNFAECLDCLQPGGLFLQFKLSKKSLNKKIQSCPSGWFFSSLRRICYVQFECEKSQLGWAQ